MNHTLHPGEGSGGRRPRPYLRFGAMIAASTALMYAATYLNARRWDHVYFSEMRVYMALLMGALMAVVMLSFMLRMHTSLRMNVAIYVSSFAVFVAGLWLARSQRTIEDVSYMRAMIPHHSIAILTSERARISDPRVRQLADGIIESQRREIAEMKELLRDLTPRADEVDRQESRSSIDVTAPDPTAVEVADGFRAEVVVSGLTYPTSVEFDDEGTMFVAEAGYSYGDPSAQARILRVSRQGEIGIVARGDPLVGPVNDLLWHEGKLFVSHRGRISVVEAKGRLRDIVQGLPSDGDHHNNQLAVGPDGRLYFGQGTATNSGVVGEDNHAMGWLQDHPGVHDVPTRDLRFLARGFTAETLLGSDEGTATTSAFRAFGTAENEPYRVQGQIKGNGAILSVNLDGSGLEIHADGLRNPFGLSWGPEGTLYATENGFDVRGSRPIANDEDDILVVRKGAWYGWPDFAMGLPVTDERFRPKGQPAPEFLLAEHPPVEQPWLTFPKHSAITKLDFASKEPFGPGQMFVAFFGHLTPMTGTPPEHHGGHRVVRIDPGTRRVETFFAKKESHSGGGKDGEHGTEASPESSAMEGRCRFVEVRFAPDGSALYVADFGSMIVRDEPNPLRRTGVIWRIVPEHAAVPGPPADLSMSRLDG